MATSSVGSPQLEASNGTPNGDQNPQNGDDLVMFLGDMFDLDAANGIAKPVGTQQPETCLSSDSLETLLLQQNAANGAFAEVTSYSSDSRDHLSGLKADAPPADTAASNPFGTAPAAAAALHSPASTRQHSPASASPRALSAGSPAISQDASANGAYSAVAGGPPLGPPLSPQLSQQSVPGVADLPLHLPHVHIVSHAVAPSPHGGTPVASPLHTPVASPTVAALAAAGASPFSHPGTMTAAMASGVAAAGLPPSVVQQQQQQQQQARHADEMYLQQQRHHQQQQAQAQAQARHQQQQQHQHQQQAFMQQQHQQHQQQQQQQQHAQHVQAHQLHSAANSPAPLGMHPLEQHLPHHHLSPLQLPPGTLHISRTPSPQPLGLGSHSPAPTALSPATSLQHVPTPPASPPPPLSPIHLHHHPQAGLQQPHSPGPTGHQPVHVAAGHHATVVHSVHPQQAAMHSAAAAQQQHPTSHAAYSHQPPQQLGMGQAATHHHLPQHTMHPQSGAAHTHGQHHAHPQHQHSPQYSQAAHTHQLVPQQLQHQQQHTQLVQQQQLAPISVVAPARSPPPPMHHNPDPFRMAAQQQPITQQLSAPQQPHYISTPPATSPHAPGYAPSSPPPHALHLHSNHSAPHPTVQPGTPPQYHGIPAPHSSALVAQPLPVTSLPPGHITMHQQQQQQHHQQQHQQHHQQQQQQQRAAAYHSAAAAPGQVSMLQAAHSQELAQLQQMHSGQLRSHSPVPLDMHGQPLLQVVAPLSPTCGGLPGSGLPSPHGTLTPNGLLASPQHSQQLSDAMDMDDTKDVMSRKEAASAVPRSAIMQAVEALRQKLHHLEVEHTQLKVQCDEMESLDVVGDMAVDGRPDEAAGSDLKNLLAAMEEHNMVLRAEISSLEQSIGM